MRILLLPIVAVLLGACGSVEYRDTNAAVDARPECAGFDDSQPGAAVPEWCERTQGATWTRNPDDGEPIDFDGDDE